LYEEKRGFKADARFFALLKGINKTVEMYPGFSPHWSVLVKGRPVLMQDRPVLVKVDQLLAQIYLPVVHCMHKLMVMLRACL
jgi:hypothetical protein